MRRIAEPALYDTIDIRAAHKMVEMFATGSNVKGEWTDDIVAYDASAFVAARLELCDLMRQDGKRTYTKEELEGLVKRLKERMGVQ